MKSQKVFDDPPTHVLIFDKDDEALTGLTAFAKEQKLSASHFTALGAFSDVTLGYFDRERKDYKKNRLSEQVEVVAMVGDIALKDGEPKVHAHVVVGRSNGVACGGHLLEAHVWPTLEVVITESPAHLRRKPDPETGLALIDLDAR